MIDIYSIFRNRVPDIRKLTEYGFSEDKDGLKKEYPVINADYRLVIEIDRKGIPDFRVFENDTGEEYLPAHIYTSTGAFVGEIHSVCEKLLRDICDKCYIFEVFTGNQTKRLFSMVRDNIGSELEFLWEDSPEYAVYRIPGKTKWFAVVMKIAGSKIDSRYRDMVEIIDLKAPCEEIERLIAEGKAYKAYHMNKKHWYTVVLDDTVTDSELLEMINLSIDSVLKKKGKR